MHQARENQQQQNSYQDVSQESDIFLRDAVDFLQGAWKVVAVTSAMGMTVSFLYLMITPRQYEAVAQIKMAQISLSTPANPFGTPVEDPPSLIARMQMPTNYGENVIAACDYEGSPQPALSLSKSIKFNAPKGLSNTVEIRLLAKSPETAKSCADAVVDQISSLQMQFAKPFVEEAKIKLSQDDERINAARKLIAKADQSGSAMSAAYLSARDELTYFLTDREKMLDLINSAEHRGTKLISPVYVSQNPVSPKKSSSLLAGLCAGIFVGLAIALGRRVFAVMRRRVG